MDIKEIQALIKFISTAGVDEVSIERKDFKLTIKKNPQTGFATMQQPQFIQTEIVQPVKQTPAQIQQAPSPEPKVAEKQEEISISNLKEIKSPMIGTFYRSSSPDKPPFVNVGSEINAGDTVCIIEAMKLFNEIESEIKGKIVKVLVDNATPVEYDQPLFLIDPS
ncbi:MAG: acetyl-CoA carboxylase biotin carboxyl carrier protein [Bacteroidetes bacterium]|nr:acetyl-CoA carboxylase biotin carboxyl carrier protein [Bacteroidota bacterium]